MFRTSFEKAYLQVSKSKCIDFLLCTLSDVFMDVGTVRLYNMAAADALLSQQRIIAIVQFRLEKKMLGALALSPCFRFQFCSLESLAEVFSKN